MLAQVAWQGNADQRVGHDEAVGRERAQPAIDIQPTGAAGGQHRHGEHRGDRR